MISEHFISYVLDDSHSDEMKQLFDDGFMDMLLFSSNFISIILRLFPSNYLVLKQSVN